MLILLSPSKRLDYESDISQNLVNIEVTQQELAKDTESLMVELKQLTQAGVKSLMGLSDKLAELNYQRFQDYCLKSKNDVLAKDSGNDGNINVDVDVNTNMRPAIFAFKGDVYDKMEVADYSQQELKFAQENLRILSGLYGVLRPLDLMFPYRLEMGTKFANQRGKNIYEFWGSKITERLNASLKFQLEESIDGKGVGEHGNKANVIINLASNEYFKAVKKKELSGRVVTIIFQQKREGKLKTIGIMAKRARGMMANFIIRNQINDPEELKTFTGGGYCYQPEISTSCEWVFIAED